MKQQRHAFRWQSSAPVNHGIRGSDRDSGIHTLVIQKIYKIAGPVYLSCSMLKRRQSFHESYRFFITCYLGFLALGLGFEPQRNKLFILKSQKQVWDPLIVFLYFLWSSSWLPLIFHYCFFIYLCFLALGLGFDPQRVCASNVRANPSALRAHLFLSLCEGVDFPLGAR